MIAVQLIAAGLTLAAAPTTVEPREAPPAPAPVSAQAKPATRYCIVDTYTGSRIPRKLCKTRDQWMDQGFDPLVRD
jgi:hypothetical protein